jgi:hypothetical protein
MMRHAGKINFVGVASQLQHEFIGIIPFCVDLKAFPRATWKRRADRPFHNVLGKSAGGLKKTFAIFARQPPDHSTWCQADIDSPIDLSLQERADLYKWLTTWITKWPDNNFRRTYTETSSPGLWRRKGAPCIAERSEVLALRHRTNPFTDDGKPVFSKDANLRLEAATFGREVVIRPCSVHPLLAAQGISDPLEVHIVHHEANAAELVLAFLPAAFPYTPSGSPELQDRRAICLDDNTGTEGAFNKGYSFKNPVLHAQVVSLSELCRTHDVDLVMMRCSTDYIPADKPTRPEQFNAPPFTQRIRLTAACWAKAQSNAQLRFSAEAWACPDDARCTTFCTSARPFESFPNPPAHVWWFNPEFTQLRQAAQTLHDVFQSTPFRFAFLLPLSPSTLPVRESVEQLLTECDAAHTTTFDASSFIFEQKPTTFYGPVSEASQFVPCNTCPFPVHIWSSRS